MTRRHVAHAFSHEDCEKPSQTFIKSRNINRTKAEVNYFNTQKALISEQEDSECHSTNFTTTASKTTAKMIRFKLDLGLLLPSVPFAALGCVAAADAEACRGCPI